MSQRQRRQQHHRGGQSPPTDASPLNHISSRLSQSAARTTAGSVGSGNGGNGWAGSGGRQQRLADCLSRDFPGRTSATGGRCPSFRVVRGFSGVASLWSFKASLLSLLSAQRHEVFNIAARLRDLSGSGIPFLPSHLVLSEHKNNHPHPHFQSLVAFVSQAVSKSSLRQSTPVLFQIRWRGGREGGDFICRGNYFLIFHAVPRLFLALFRSTGFVSSDATAESKHHPTVGN